MKLYKVASDGAMIPIIFRGMKVQAAGEEYEKINFDIEWRVYFTPDFEQGTIDIRIEFPPAGHWVGIENIEGVPMSDIDAVAQAVIAQVQEDYPELSIGELSAAIMTSDVSAVSDFAEDEVDEVLDENIQRIIEKRKQKEQQRAPKITQEGPGFQGGGVKAEPPSSKAPAAPAPQVQETEQQRDVEGR